MFTLEQIDHLHERLGRSETLVEYVFALRVLGVEKYDSYLTDGHSKYFGVAGNMVISPPMHDELIVSEVVDKEAFLDHLKLHEQGETSYVEMSEGLAKSGIEKWTVNTREATMIYYDTVGNEVLVEKIE